MRLILASSLAFSVALLAAASAGGATFTVNKTVDSTDTIPGDGLCQDAELLCSLRAAIQEANVLGGADTIDLPADTYTIDATVGAGENLAATGDLDIMGTLVINGAGAGTTIVQAGGGGSVIDRVFHVLVGASLTMSGVTIRDGAALDATTFTGGGILNQGSLTLFQCVIDNNRANTGGGIDNSVGTLVVDECTFSGNQAVDAGFTNAFGGALLSHEPGGTSDIANTTFSSNSAAGTGGAIWASNSTSLTLANSTLSDNTGTALGFQNTDGFLTHVTIHNNQGAGLHAFSFNGAHLLDLTNTVVGGNKGVDCSFSAPPMISRVGSLGSDGSCGFALDNMSPNLGLLQDNGGLTLTHEPQAGSALIDNAFAPDCLSPDQRGELRPDGSGGLGACDIGAVEFVPEPGGWLPQLSALLLMRAIARRRRA